MRPTFLPLFEALLLLQEELSGPQKMTSNAATTTHKKVGFHAVMINWSLERLESFSKSHSLNHHLESHLQNSLFYIFSLSNNSSIFHA
jgi:hypothetical protein